MTLHETTGQTEPRRPDCHALILAGGSGTRLWPLSRALFPKQLLPLKGDKSLLYETVARALRVFAPKNIHVITNEEHIFEVRNQLKSLNPMLEAQAIAEPVGRNTLPAVLLGLQQAQQEHDTPLLAVFPSDHHIDDVDTWEQALLKGLDLARQDWFVTFGAPPTKPETGFGYIALGDPLDKMSNQVSGFIEKPDIERAREFCQSGAHLWNSGIFMFSAKALVNAVQQFQPELYSWWETRMEKSLLDDYSSIPDISIDYGIMEHVQDIAVVHADFGWSDLGSWEALYRLGDKDHTGCVTEGDVLSLDNENCLLLSTGAKLATVGLKNCIVVQTRDATLVCAVDQVQRVKDVVTSLKQQHSPLVETHLTVKRPWGSYTVLEEGSRYKIKRIEVLPGATLSLQMHHHRSEHWVVIKGTASVLVGEKEMVLVENQSVDIPQATKHRLGNPGKVPVEIIEIQSGPYLEEDDIVRFEDVYGRQQH